MTVVDRFSKPGTFILCLKDMTANDLVYVFLCEVIRLKECPRQIVSDRDKLFQSQVWKELAQRFKIEMHQPPSRQRPSKAQQPVDPPTLAHTWHLW